MGWSCSWVALQEPDRATVLETLGFEETGHMVEPGSGASKWSLGEVGGWLIVFSEDFDWGGSQRVRDLSKLAPAVGLQFEDRVEMASFACAAQGGEELWRVSHVNSADEREALVVTGDPPTAFESIRDGLIKQQNEADDDSVDYLHDIPIDVAKSACGYRTDEWIPPFMALRRIGSAAQVAGPAETGGLLDFLKRLFSSKR